MVGIILQSPEYQVMLKTLCDHCGTDDTPFMHSIIVDTDDPVHLCDEHYKEWQQWMKPPKENNGH